MKVEYDPELQAIFDNQVTIDEFVSCGRKIRYSEVSAARAAEAMAKKTRREFDAYKCRHCDAWHIGKKPRWFPAITIRLTA